MQPLTAVQLLSIWEQGHTKSQTDRALLLLAAACDDMPVEQQAQLPIGARDDRLLTLREWAFGSQIAGSSVCPTCGEPVEFSFTISDVRYVPQQTANYKPQTAQVNGYTVQYRLPNSEDVAALAEIDQLSEARERLLHRCLQNATHDGTTCDVKQLPPAVVQQLIAKMAAADPQADIRINLNCPDCENQWEAAFDITSFFWTEVDVWARRTLQQIHALASVYGWRECEILALSPQRRQLYVNMAGG